MNKSATQTALPRLDVMDDPLYREAHENLQQLNRELAEAQALIGRLGDQPPREHPDAFRAMVKGLTEQEQQAAAAPTAGPELIYLNEQQRAELGQRRRKLAKAIEMQRRVLEERRTQLSKQFCQQIFPAHRDAVRRVIACLVELSTACEAERQVREILIDSGAGVIDPIRAIGPMPAFWDRTDDYSTINLIIKEAREHGYLPKLTGNQARDTKALAEALPAVEVAPIDDNESWTEVR